MKHLQLILILLFFLIGNHSHAQSTIIPQWVSHYGTGTGYYGQSNIEVNAQGDVFGSGYFAPSSGFTSSMIFKYNSFGILQWANTIDSTWFINKLTRDSDNNVYLVCSKWRNGVEYIYISKYDSSRCIFMGTIL